MRNNLKTGNKISCIMVYPNGEAIVVRLIEREIECYESFMRSGDGKRPKIEHDYLDNNHNYLTEEI